jgi:thiamine pyrophosphokinase
MFDLDIHENKDAHGYEPIKAFTTYNTALAIALHHGAKTVYTNGIDGGHGRHETFQSTHQTYKPNYDAQFEEEKRMLEQYNAKVVRVL